MKQEEIKLWAFYYNPMVYESASIIVSYHITKKGAIKAMNEHKEDERKEHNRMYAKDPKWKIKFGAFQSWHVSRFTLFIMP